MPLLTFQIAALDHIPLVGDTDATKEYDFQDLQGTPIPATEQVSVIQRPGVDYHGLRRTGKRGRPFTLRSIEYGDTLANASAQLALYKALIGVSLGVKVTQRDLVYYPCDVLAVEFASPPSLVAAVAGALVPSPNVRLSCVWQLIMRQA